MGKLSATAVKAATRPGRLGDGDGLFLVIQPGGGKSWMCRVQKNGNRRDFGLGSASKVSLATARERAREIRTWVELGLDPIFERRLHRNRLPIERDGQPRPGRSNLQGANAVEPNHVVGAGAVQQCPDAGHDQAGP